MEIKIGTAQGVPLTFADIGDANAQLVAWQHEINTRRHGTHGELMSARICERTQRTDSATRRTCTRRPGCHPYR